MTRAVAGGHWLGAAGTAGGTDAGGGGEGDLLVRIDGVTGAVDRLQVRGDPAAMNWVTGSDQGWHPGSCDWGLGVVGGHPSGSGDDAPVRWQRAVSVEFTGDGAISTYRTCGWSMRVTRRLESGDLLEDYVLSNDLDHPRDVGSLQVYVPFSTDLVHGSAAASTRCHAHVWAGGRDTWINALRWSGRGPHLGLAVRHGSIAGYGLDSATEHAGSVVRGDLSLVLRDVLQRGSIPTHLLRPDSSNGSGPAGNDTLEPAGSAYLTLEPGAELAFGWTVFSHDGTGDFAATAARRSGRAGLLADRYVVVPGEVVRARTTSGGVAPELHMSHPGVLRAAADGQFVAIAPGTTRLIHGPADTPSATTTIGVVAPISELLALRTAFVVDHQQVHSPGAARHGALVPYDNRVGAQLLHPPRHDYNEGRERVGMGVLLAQAARLQPAPMTTRALADYAAFVGTQLQSPDGEVFDSAGDRSINRLYNYPWVARFWLELHAVTADPRHLDAYLRTMLAYYAAGGADFYAIGVPVLRGVTALRRAGRADDATEVLRHHLRHGALVTGAGSAYPGSEVPFEQSIVAPAAGLLYELALVTGDREHARAADPHLALLELFAGQQPDAHLHNVPVRHWDGFWFGIDQRWGDVMPHHWAAISAWVFALKAAVDDDEEYQRRAVQLSRATLLCYDRAGAASCAFTYPLIVSGRRGHSWDPLANDQDWALVTAVDIVELADNRSHL